MLQLGRQDLEFVFLCDLLVLIGVIGASHVSIWVDVGEITAACPRGIELKWKVSISPVESHRTKRNSAFVKFRAFCLPGIGFREHIHIFIIQVYSFKRMCFAQGEATNAEKNR